MIYNIKYFGFAEPAPKYKARYYSPDLGRFLQTDPIGYEDQINRYAYVGNDPVNGIDPFGLCVNTPAKGKKSGGSCINPVPGSEELTERDTSRRQGDGEYHSNRTGHKHHGIDILADEGADVVAAGDGRIAAVGEGKTNGKYIEIYHPDGLVTRYWHLKTIIVKKSDKVSAGDKIGTVGRTGNVPPEGDAHLHFETLTSNSGSHPWVDPEDSIGDNADFNFDPTEDWREGPGESDNYRNRAVIKREDN